MRKQTSEIVVETAEGQRHKVRMTLDANVIYIGDFSLGEAFNCHTARYIRQLEKRQDPALFGPVRPSGTKKEKKVDKSLYTKTQALILSTDSRYEAVREERKQLVLAAFTEAEGRWAALLAAAPAATAPPIVVEAAPETAGKAMNPSPLPPVVSPPVKAAAPPVPVLEEDGIPMVLVTNSVELQAEGINADLFLLENGTRVVAPGRICDRLGLDTDAQRAVIRGNEAWRDGVFYAVLPTAGGPQKTLVLDIIYFLPWTLNISPSKVRADLRSRIKAWQKHFFEVLYDYQFGSGVVVNPRISEEAARSALENYLAERRAKDAALDAEREEGLALLAAQCNRAGQDSSGAALAMAIQTALVPVMQSVQALIEGLALTRVALPGNQPVIGVPQVGTRGTWSSTKLAEKHRVPMGVVREFSLALRIVGDMNFGEPSPPITPHHGHFTDNWRHDHRGDAALQPYCERYRERAAHHHALGVEEARAHALALDEVLSTIVPIGKGTWTALSQPTTNSARVIRPFRVQ
jgi:hypothetical protein